MGGCSFDRSGSIEIDDVEADAGEVEPPFPYTPSNFDPEMLQPAGSIKLDCGMSGFDSQALIFRNWCGEFEPTPVVDSGVVILAMDDLEIASGSSLVLLGDRPVILAVFGSATISGDLDASGKGSESGPGGAIAGECTNGTGGNGMTANDTGGGGGGGGFGARGSFGGFSYQTGPRGTAGSPVGNETLTPLRGGCSGGQGGLADGFNGGLGGGGGGAIQISAASLLQVSGRVIAAGGGGRQVEHHAGGGGGGSGGGILLEGDVVQVVSTALLWANGGGGGEGGANNQTDRNDDGEDGHPDANPPGDGGSGESGTGGDGGDGGDAQDPSTDGQSGGSTYGGGGGGGGAVGRIRINAASSCTIEGTSTLSPTPTRNAGC